MSEQLLEEEENVHMIRDEQFDTVDRFLKLDELTFTWFFTRVVQKISKLCGTNHALFQRKHISYHIQLIITFVLFIATIIVGAIYLNNCYTERMICIFLIVQGVTGLVVVLVHIFAAIVE